MLSLRLFGTPALTKAILPLTHGSLWILKGSIAHIELAVSLCLGRLFGYVMQIRAQQLRAFNVIPPI